MLLFHVDETRAAHSNRQPSRLNQETSRLGNMKAFRVDGQAPFGRLRQKFSVDVVASSKSDAEHRVYSIMGSRHKAKRRAINIDSVNEIDPRTSLEPSVLHHFREEIAAAGGTIAPVDEEE
jgi:ribosomal protein L20A (L18A)